MKSLIVYPLNAQFGGWLFNFDFGGGEDWPRALVGGARDARELDRFRNPAGVDEFSSVGRICRNRAEEAMGWGVEAGLEGHGAAFIFGAERRNLEVVAQNLAAASVDDSGGGAELLVSGGSNVLFREIHETAVLLQQREKRRDFGLWARRSGWGSDGLLRGGGGGFCALLAGGEKHTNHANGCRDGLSGERDVLVGMVDGGEVDAQKDKAAGDEWSFHKRESFSG